MGHKNGAATTDRIEPQVRLKPVAWMTPSEWGYVPHVTFVAAVAEARRREGRQVTLLYQVEGAENAQLRNALGLAANRLERLALNQEQGSPGRSEVLEWSSEARRAMGHKRKR